MRAKTNIPDARIPYQVPSRAKLADPLDTALHEVYLVFQRGVLRVMLTRPDHSGEVPFPACRQIVPTGNNSCPLAPFPDGCPDGIRLTFRRIRGVRLPSSAPR